jgi:hypothetical protein
MILCATCRQTIAFTQWFLRGCVLFGVQLVPARRPGPVRPVGVEYGTDWIVRHILAARLTPVDGEAMYEDLLDECYPEVRIGFGSYAVSDILKHLDPVAFRIGVGENLDSLAEDGVLFEFDGDYYRMEDLDDLFKELESE